MTLLFILLACLALYLFGKWLTKVGERMEHWGEDE